MTHSAINVAQVHISAAPSATLQAESVALPVVKPASLLQVQERVSVLYVFAGRERQSDVGGQLKRLHAKEHLHLVELDLLRDESHNVLSPDCWEPAMQQLRSGRFKVLVITPPCNTHSRARSSNSEGPPPIRSKAYPLGFPWLFGKHLRAATLANALVDKTISACHIAQDTGVAWIIEHPEDLGVTAGGDIPASIFSLPQLLQLAKSSKASSMAFHPCQFGANSSKPTRTVSTVPLLQEGVLLFQGWPTFSASSAYLGPLPKACGHYHKGLLGREKDGSFKTSAAAAYPEAMCKWLANCISRHCIAPAGPKAGVLEPVAVTMQAPATPSGDSDTSAEDEPGVPKPLLKNHVPGRGPPMSARWAGKVRELQDGGGLCSPGRWLPSNRIPTTWKAAMPLRVTLEKILLAHIPNLATLAMGLACNKFETCPFSEELLAEGRAAWFAAISKDSALGISEIAEVQPNQPFHLKAIGETLRLMNDPDWRVFYASKTR